MFHIILVYFISVVSLQHLSTAGFVGAQLLIKSNVANNKAVIFIFIILFILN
tara:strand:- start:120 stop:275 length:156 start_codon:yes stop_codon:yes gene_type:complete